MELSIKTDFKALERQLNGLQRDIADRARYSAITKMARQARTAMSREIRGEYNLTAGEVNERLKVEVPRFGKGSFVIEARLVGRGRAGRGRSMNVIRFAEKSISLAQARRRMKRGEGKGGRALDLRVKIKKGGQAKVIKGAFIGNKGRTVFIRAEGARRLPINAVQTIDVPQMFNARKTKGAVLEMIRRQFPVVMQREIAYYTRIFNNGKRGF
jgi:hypothetical protein